MARSFFFVKGDKNKINKSEKKKVSVNHIKIKLFDFSYEIS